MPTYAIGDIHGCITALDALIRRVRPGPGDTVVTLGDAVNRGPDARAVLDRLIEIRDDTRLVSIRGNHDFMMIIARSHEDGRRAWVSMGGRATLDSYPDRSIANVPSEHWEFLSDFCRDWYETDSHIYVHASVDPSLPMENQPLTMLHWARLNLRAQPHESGKVVVCAHTAQLDGHPVNLGHTVCVDTGCVYGGWLTCLDVDSGHYWQANEDGEVREATLPAVM